jgi:hypothetical protein
MPLKLSQVMGKTVSTSLNLAEDGEPEATLTVTYRVGAYTPNFLVKLQEARDSDPRIIGEMLARLLVEWDLCHDNGEVIAIKTESINEYVPFDLQARIVNRLMDHASPNPKSPVISGNSSLQAAEEGPVLENMN